MKYAPRLSLLGIAIFLATMTSSVHAAPPPIAGINKAACAYFTVADAIAAARKGDTIYIEPGTYTELLGEIDTSMTLVPALAGKDCKLEDTGATSATVIIDGGGGSDDSTGGLVEIASGASVTFRHMWLRNATATNGGIIAVTGGGDLILDDANVTDGTASSSGGNIYALTSSTNLSTVRLINGSNVYRGEATLGDGGAIALFGGTLTVDSGGIGVSSNNGFSTAANNGGGIYADGATINLNSSTANVIWNQAGAHGGGIYARNTKINMTDARVEHNQANKSGGGIYLLRSTGVNDLLTVNGGTISFNSTTNSTTNDGGGGLFIDGVIEASLNNVAINENFSDNVGGAIAARTAVKLTLTDSTIDGNQAGGPGGAIYLAQSATTLTVDGSSIENNESGTIGGGVYSAFASVLLRNNTLIVGNQAQTGGGIYLIGTSNNNSNSMVSASDSMISLNKALSPDASSGNGGGLFAIDARIAMTDTYFTLNEAQRKGGGIHLNDTDSELRMTRGGFSANRTLTSGSNQGGGAIYAENALEIFFDDVTLEGNESNNSGGAIHMRGGVDLYMQGGWLGYNRASGSGGAIYAAQSNSQIVMTDTLISHNFANTTGGGIQATFTPGQFTNVEVRDNEADSGAGMYLWFTEATFVNSVFAGNSATENGGGLFLNGAEVVFESIFDVDCAPFSLPANTYCAELRDNTAGEQGGAIYMAGSISSNHDGRLNIEHAVLLGNQAPMGGAAVYISGVYTPTVMLTNTLLSGNGNNTDDSTIVEQEGAGTLSLNSVTLAGNFDNPLWLLDGSAQLTLTNSILYENLGGPRVPSAVSTAGILCNLSQAPENNSRNLGTNVNPNFTTTARGDYRLNSTSPALDACNNGPPRDADLGFRPVGVRFDQGAFERGSTTTHFTLTVNGPAGSGSGRITSSPAGIDCPGDCSESFPGNASITLAATPDLGATFDGWGSAACPGTGDCTLIMNAAKSVTPAFTLNTYALTVNKSGSGTVSSNPAGIDCGGDCSEVYTHGTQVTLSATPAAGSTFAGWGGVCNGTGACIVTMDSAKSVSAGFAQENVTHTVTVAVDGSGTVSSDPSGILCGSGGADCAESYAENTPVELSATVDTGNTFAGWSGDCTGTDPCLLSVDADKVVTATFATSLISHTLSVTPTGSGSGVVTSTPGGITCGDGNLDCDEQYAINSLVTLTATPSSGSIFDGWRGACTGTALCPVTLDMTQEVTATFTLITHTLSVTATGGVSGAVSSNPVGINCDSSPGGTQACAAAYIEGTAVTLTPVPVPGTVFSAWSDDCTGNGACVVTMDADHTVGALFATSGLTFTLGVTTAGDGAGSIIGNGDAFAAAIECGSGEDQDNQCEQPYSINTQVTLIATADTGSTFVGWTGACSGTEVCVVNMVTAKSVVAVFELVPENHDLNVVVVGAGSVSSDPAGIACADDCAESYLGGTVVSLTTTSGVGATFTGWSGACSGSGACSVNMVAPRTVTATFGAAQFALDVTLLGDGEGVVSSTPGGINCGIDCQTDFVFDTTVTLTATAEAGSVFAGWSGACSGTGPCAVTMDGAQAVTARMNLVGQEPTNFLPNIMVEP